MQQGSIGTRARWAARTGMGLGLAAALASGCAEDEADPVLDSVPLGELSPAQMRSLCDELGDVRARQRSASCIPSEVIGSGSYALIQDNPASCVELESLACDVTAGEVRACERALRADVCSGGNESTAACAPFIQRGCAAEGSAAWLDACPGLAADVAAFEGIYELSRHTVNDTSCDAEGASVLETDAQRLFVVVTIVLYGAPIGRMDTCDELEHCRAVADSLRRYSERTDPAVAPYEGGLRSRQLLCHPTIEGALQAERASARIPQEGRCDLEQTQEVITHAQDGTLRLEGRTRAWQQPPENGFCPTLSGPDGPVPPDVECSRLQVYEARLVSAL